MGKSKNNSNYKTFVILLVGSFVVYFVMHSVFWWKGLFGSLGLHRVMAGVAPLFGVVALCGYNLIAHFLPHKVYLKKFVLSLIILAVVVYPFKQYRPPLKPDTEMQVLINTSKWIHANSISSNHKVYCMYPILAMLLDVDPFNQYKYISTCMLKYPDFSNALKTDDLIIWDAHFGNECGFLPEEIAKLSKVKKIATFSQSNNAKQEFKVVVFKVTN